MKTSLLVLIILAFSYSLYAQRKIKITEVEESGFVITTTFKSLGADNMNAANGLNIKIEPIDPITLDEMFYRDYISSGQYNYSYYDKSVEKFFLKRKSWHSRKYKSEYSFFNEGLDYLSNEGIISDSVVAELQNQLIDKYVDPEDNIRKETEVPVSQMNPFFVGTTYLSTFSVEIKNNSDDFVRFDNNLQIITKANLLSPLNLEEIEMFSSNPLEKIQNYGLLKYNMKPSEIIPPNSSIRKFIACFPLDLDDSSVKIFYEEASPDMLAWNINYNKVLINDKKEYYEFRLYPKNLGSLAVDDVIAAVLNDTDAFIQDQSVFVAKSRINVPLDIIALSIYSNRLWYKKYSVVPSSLLDMKKGRAEYMTIDLEEIPGLERKMK